MPHVFPTLSYFVGSHFQNPNDCGWNYEDNTMGRSASSSQLSPDELKQLADTQIAQAKRIETGPERLRILAFADALINVAEIKKRLLHYERQLLN
jgi:hypothetical protein